jgi:DNA-binding CsgD family transcriptional regulator
METVGDPDSPPAKPAAILQTVTAEPAVVPVERRKRSRRATDRDLQRLGPAVACLEHIGEGVMLLDTSCQVVYLTDSAGRLLETCKEQLNVQNRQLIFHQKDYAGNFETCSEWLLGGSPAAGSGHTFLVERRPPRQPLIFSVFSLPPRCPSDHAAARLLVILRDPDRQSAVPWQVFARQFQLTPAELRLCVAWANGLSLAEYSEKFHVSPHTARSQLKSVFDKTGTHRQVQLLRLIFAFVRP